MIGRFINADCSYVFTGQDFTGCNVFAFCGNNPINRSDYNGKFWNTIVGAVAGAVVGGITAAVMGTDIKAGIVSGAINGAITGAAIDITIATGGTGLVAFAAVTAAGGVGGAISSYVNQRMNGTPHKKVDWGEVAVDGMWGAIGAALSFGVADIGGPRTKTLKQIFRQSTRKLGKQALRDFSSSTIISFGTWLNGTKIKYLLQ